MLFLVRNIQWQYCSHFWCATFSDSTAPISGARHSVTALLPFLVRDIQWQYCFHFWCVVFSDSTASISGVWYSVTVLLWFLVSGIQWQYCSHFWCMPFSDIAALQLLTLSLVVPSSCSYSPCRGYRNVLFSYWKPRQENSSAVGHGTAIGSDIWRVLLEKSCKNISR